MLKLICDPPCPPAPAVPSKTAEPFFQSIRLVDGRELLGQARWQCAADPSQGVVQLLALSVSPPYRRQGHGRRLMDAVVGQGMEYFQVRKLRLRRVWVAIEQKRQIIARSFLMQFGFNHVGTVSELLKDEDLLIYMRTFD